MPTRENKVKTCTGVNTVQVCFLCQAPASEQCSHCKLVYYCSKAHYNLHRVTLREVSEDLVHGIRTSSEEIAFTALHGHKSTPTPIFCLPYWPKFSDFFDWYLHWVSVVRALVPNCTIRWLFSIKWYLQVYYCSKTNYNLHRITLRQEVNEMPFSPHVSAHVVFIYRMSQGKMGKVN